MKKIFFGQLDKLLMNINETCHFSSQNVATMTLSMRPHHILYVGTGYMYLTLMLYTTKKNFFLRIFFHSQSSTLHNVPDYCFSNDVELGEGVRMLITKYGSFQKCWLDDVAYLYTDKD